MTTHHGGPWVPFIDQPGTPMRGDNLALPDVMLVLDVAGIIRDATLSNSFASEGVSEWIGSPWSETVAVTDGDKIRRMLADTRSTGVCAFRHLTQRFPSGLEIPIEYTTVRLGDHTGVLAIGKNMRAVAELQARLVEAQQSMERDYWKLREVETRYRLLFNSSSDAVLLLRTGDLGIVELNPAAARALGVSQPKTKASGNVAFPELLAEADRELFAGMVQRIRERGKAPGILVRLGDTQVPWMVRSSLVTSVAEEVYLVQLAPAAAAPTFETGDPIRVDDLVESAPDGFVVIDSHGVVLRANRTFVEMVQMGSESAVLGESLSRWLGRPGADLTVLLANVSRLGSVRLFSTTLRGDLGSEIEAEISASGRSGRDAGKVAVFLRDVTRRLPAVTAGGGALEGLLDSLTKQIGKTTLRKLVEDTVSIVERRYIEAALNLTGGNRTAAAELLGLSRQSLYAKLNRYGLDEGGSGVAG
jgi:transcriptional regulator PpsR